MAEITAAMVRELRERSGAGMMECKKALAATNGDPEAALDELRKAGLKSAEKKSGRTTGEGRVWAVLADDRKKGAMIALSCETDFVARTPDFEGFLQALTTHVLENAPQSVEQCLEQTWSAGGTVADALKATIGKLGENIQLTQVGYYANPAGAVAAYLHHDDKKGAFVNVTTSKPDEDALKDLCMHIVVFNPGALNRDAIPADAVEREKAIIREGLAGKPEEIQERILSGRIEKFYAEQVITEQPWIKDDKQTVQKALEAAMGAGTVLEGFVRFEVGGEG